MILSACSIDEFARAIASDTQTNAPRFWSEAQATVVYKRRGLANGIFPGNALTHTHTYVYGVAPTGESQPRQSTL